jgi:ADP-ribose pyrophosphatase
VPDRALAGTARNRIIRFSAGDVFIPAVETPDNWTTISSDVHFADDHLSVVTERVRTPHRSEAHAWTIVRRKSAVVVAAMTAEGNFVLIRQERIPIRKAIWEMPAGQVDQLCDFGSFRDVALRELREETGYELAPGGETIFLGDFFSSPGFTDEREFLFLARPVQRAIQHHTHHDAEMILDCREFSPAQITAMIADDTIRDANTLSTWARLIAKGIIQLQPR